MPLHILENVGGGAEVQAWLYARQMAKLGYEVSYICQSVQGKTGKEVVDGVTLFWVKKQPYFECLNAGVYKRILKQTKPQIVIQRMTSAITGVLGQFCKKNGSKFVWICTDDRIPSLDSLTASYLKQARKKGKSKLNRLVFGGYARFSDWQKNRGIRLADYRFVQNEAQAQKLRKNFGLDAQRIESGHEKPAFSGTKNREDILWVANWGTRKRPELFMELARQLPKLSFVMIGSNPDANYRKHIEKQQTDNLQVRGKLPFDETLSAFNSALAFVNTSEPDSEGFPNTFIQAWLRGVPVISFGVDPDGIIERKGLGFVVQNVAEAAEKLDLLLSDEILYQEMSQKATKYANENHAIDVVVERFLAQILN